MKRHLTFDMKKNGNILINAHISALKAEISENEVVFYNLVFSKCGSQSIWVLKSSIISHPYIMLIFTKLVLSNGKNNVYMELTACHCKACTGLDQKVI